MNENKVEENINEENGKKPPKSSRSNNTFKDFFKICRAYYDELMHLSKNKEPSLSQKDIIILSDVIDEIVTYSNELISNNFITQAKDLLNIGLVISDFLLKIFQKMIEEYQLKLKKDDKENININHTLSEKLRYPLSLKLRLLKSNFKIIITYDKDYPYAEKNLKEIIEIQIYLKSSNYNLASSKFWLAKIEYFLEKYDEAEKLALEAKYLFENTKQKNKENKNENNNNNNINNKSKETNEELENSITQNVSNIFRFLSQIYLIKNDYKSAATYYEHGYYLNLGRNGAENPDTIYFKTKLDALNNELSNYPSFPNVKMKTNNTNIDINSQKNINNNINNNNFNNNNDFNNFEKIMHKGQAETFSFKIPSTSFLEPLLITLYEIENNPNMDRYASELLFGNVLLDKQKLSKYLKLKGNNINSLFYTDENLNIILGNLEISNGNLIFLDKNLKNCLINTSCLTKKK